VIRVTGDWEGYGVVVSKWKEGKKEKGGKGKEDRREEAISPGSWAATNGEGE
jgi:hypothetical protein